MKVSELKKFLETLPDDLEVYHRRMTATGNIEEVGTVNMDTYGFFGESIPCVILDGYKDDEA